MGSAFEPDLFVLQHETILVSKTASGWVPMWWWR